ncbi:hypothetical protein GOBAR_DD21231 [Gossypium barbadense]|nr:hypothetical protein GOBAR_DD21231 [Gossypium barbadense]
MEVVLKTIGQALPIYSGLEWDFCYSLKARPSYCALAYQQVQPTVVQTVVAPVASWCRPQVVNFKCNVDTAFSEDGQ